MANWGAYWYSFISKNSDKPATEPVLTTSSTSKGNSSDGKKVLGFSWAKSKSEDREYKNLNDINSSLSIKSSPILRPSISDTSEISKKFGDTDPTATVLPGKCAIREPSVISASNKTSTPLLKQESPVTSTESKYKSRELSPINIPEIASPNSPTNSSAVSTPATPIVIQELAYEINKMSLKPWIDFDNSSKSSTPSTPSTRSSRSSLIEATNQIILEEHIDLAEFLTPKISENEAIPTTLTTLSTPDMSIALEELNSLLNLESSVSSADTKFSEVPKSLLKGENKLALKPSMSLAGSVTSADLQIEGPQTPIGLVDQMRKTKKTTRHNIPKNKASRDKIDSIVLELTPSSFDNPVELSIAAQCFAPLTEIYSALSQDPHDNTKNSSISHTEFLIQEHSDFKNLQKNKSGDKKQQVLSSLLADLQSNSTHKCTNAVSKSLPDNLAQTKTEYSVPALNSSLVQSIIPNSVRLENDLL